MLWDEVRTGHSYANTDRRLDVPVPVARPPKGLAETGFDGNPGVALGWEAGVKALKVDCEFAAVEGLSTTPVSAGVDSGCCFAWGCDDPSAKGDFVASAVFAAFPVVGEVANTVRCITSGSECDVRLLSTIVFENV